MQVNVCPSLSSSSPMDRKIKHILLTDTLNLLGMEHLTKKDKENLNEKKKDRLWAMRQDKRYFSKNINNLQNLTYDNCIDILTPEDWMILFESE